MYTASKRSLLLAFEQAAAGRAEKELAESGVAEGAMGWELVYRLVVYYSSLDLLSERVVSKDLNIKSFESPDFFQY